MARHVAPRSVHLSDYTPPAYLVDRVELRFSLFEDFTRVSSRMTMRRNQQQDSRVLVLDGHDLELVRLLKDGRKLAADAYRVDEEGLVIEDPGERFTLEIETLIHPEKNASLEGLYKSGGNFCTQCEAEGFRKITYYPDRPDVLARFSVIIEADKAAYPVLLANGNPVESGALENGRHFARWEDPFPKPSYLFALVAGRLACVADEFTTCSGRRVQLRVYVEDHNVDKCQHALRCLQNAMRWDEERFGREYDLDIYMIVAVDDFNMGAMENKGLNIFNSKYVLARPETATDRDFIAIETVVAHEYFHNWSGNRVTCRDWFQLTLKEGLTVFRDQEFTADRHSRALKRIEDVRFLRKRQFAEDAGPMAHAIQPASYMEINNFYTATVYNKGAEVIRMIQTLLGERGFRRGMDLYFASHDGEAATTEDFLRAMEDATGIQLQQFRRWYHQAGTPRLEVTTQYEPQAQCFHVTLRQLPPDGVAEDKWQPLHIPVRVGLLDPDGHEIALRLEGEQVSVSGSRVLELKDTEQTFRFADISVPPSLSVLRDFSAPVELLMERSDAELAFLMVNDTDPFNRWDAGEQLATRLILNCRDSGTGNEHHPDCYLDALQAMLTDDSLDPAMLAEALKLPDENELSGRLAQVDVEAIHEAHQRFGQALVAALQPALARAFQRNADVAPDDGSPAASARRRLAGVCLDYLVLAPEDSWRQLALERVQQARNMTEQVGALRALVHAGCPEGEAAIEAFEQHWSQEPLVMDKWFSVQATAPLATTRARVEQLLAHPGFHLENPNRVRSLIGAYAETNHYGFHLADGSGYRLLAEQVLRLDGFNPSTAARLVGPLTRWHRYGEHRRAMMRAELMRMADVDDLSRNLYEQVSKSLDKAAAGSKS